MYKDIIAKSGNLLFVDYGGDWGDFSIPSKLTQITDELMITRDFSYDSVNEAVAKDRAYRWFVEIRYRIRRAIYNMMARLYEVQSDSSTSQSESNSLRSFFYTSDSISTESSSLSSTSAENFPIAPSVLTFWYKQISPGVLAAYLEHDICYPDKKKLAENPIKYVNYGPLKMHGFTVPKQVHELKDKLVVEMRLRYTTENYNNAVNVLKEWYRVSSVNVRKALNQVR